MPNHPARRHGPASKTGRRTHTHTPLNTHTCNVDAYGITPSCIEGLLRKTDYSYLENKTSVQTLSTAVSQPSQHLLFHHSERKTFHRHTKIHTHTHTHQQCDHWLCYTAHQSCGSGLLFLLMVKCLEWIHSKELRTGLCFLFFSNNSLDLTLESSTNLQYWC